MYKVTIFGLLVVGAHSSFAHVGHNPMKEVEFGLKLKRYYFGLNKPTDGGMYNPVAFGNPNDAVVKFLMKESKTKTGTHLLTYMNGYPKIRKRFTKILNLLHKWYKSPKAQTTKKEIEIMEKVAELHELMWKCKTFESAQKHYDNHTKMTMAGHGLRGSTLNEKERKNRWYWTYSELIEEMILYLHGKIFKKDGSPRQKVTFDPWIQVLYKMPALFFDWNFEVVEEKVEALNSQKAFGQKDDDLNSWYLKEVIEQKVQKVEAVPLFTLKEFGVQVLRKTNFKKKDFRKLYWIKLLKFKEAERDSPETRIIDLRNTLSYLGVRSKNSTSAKKERKKIYKRLDQEALTYEQLISFPGLEDSDEEEPKPVATKANPAAQKPAVQKPVTPKPAAPKPVTPKAVSLAEADSQHRKAVSQLSQLPSQKNAEPIIMIMEPKLDVENLPAVPSVC